MKIKYSVILCWLLLLVAYFNHNSVLYVGNKQLVNFISIVVCMFGLLYTKKNFSVKAFCLLLFLLVNITFVRFISGGVGITIWLHWFIEIASIVCAYTIGKETFFDRYVKMIVFFAIISLIGMAIWGLDPNVWESIMPVYYNSSMRYRGFQFLFLVSSSLDHYGRNVGIFTEPGLYQIPLNTAIFFLMVTPEKLNISKKKRSLYLVILLLTILSTKSTSAFIATIAIVMCALLISDISTKRKLIIFGGSVMTLLGMEVLINGHNSILYAYLINKIFDENGINLSVGNGKYRIRTIPYVVEVMKKFVWGAGYDNYNAYVQMNGGHLNELVGVECLKAFAYFGTPQMLAVYSWLAVTTYRNSKNIVQFILVVFLYLNTTMAQTDIFYPALVILIFANFKCENDKTTRLVPIRYIRKIANGYEESIKNFKKNFN